MKKRRRGYNQSEKIAEGMANLLTAELKTNVLYRTVYTEAQTKKGMSVRWTSMEEIFKANETSDIKDQRILLVDDVITTGATVESAVLCLHELQPKSISVSALASGQ